MNESTGIRNGRLGGCRLWRACLLGSLANHLPRCVLLEVDELELLERAISVVCKSEGVANSIRIQGKAAMQEGSKARQEGTKEELLASFDGTLREDANSMVALHEKHASNAVRTIRMIRETDLVPFTCRIHHIVCIEEFHPTGETAFQKRILPSYSLCTFLVCNQKALTTFRGNYRVCNKCRDHPK